MFDRTRRWLARMLYKEVRSTGDNWVDIFDVNKSASGVSVNEASAKQLSAVYRAVSLLSGDVAKLPCHVFMRNGENKERAPTHPAYSLIRYKPNRLQTAYQFFQLVQSRASLLGNGYAWVVRNQQLNPEEIIPLPPTTYPEELQDGSVIYRSILTTGQQLTLRSDEVLHIRGVGQELEGDSLLKVARDSFGEGIAMQQYSGDFFKNGAAPLITLEHPGRLSPEAQTALKKAWADKHSGMGNTHGIAVLQEGMKANPWSMTLRDAEFVAGRKHSVRDIANWFGVPPHKLGDETRTAFASLEQENQQYLDEALDPWLVNWEQELRTKLLRTAEQEADSHVIEFARNALVRANMKERFASYNVAIQGGWMSRDEARARENMNPIPDGEGQVFLQPLNMVPVGEGLPDDDDDRDPDRDDDDENRSVRWSDFRTGDFVPPTITCNGSTVGTTASATVPATQPVNSTVLLNLVRAASNRVTSRLSNQAKRAAKKPEKFLQWLDSTEEQRESLREYLEPAVEACNQYLGQTVEPDGLVTTALRTFHERMLTAAECSPDMLPGSVEECGAAIETEIEELMIGAYV